MTYYADQITEQAVNADGAFAIVTATCVSYDVVQCYLNGELVGYAYKDSSNQVEFHLPALGSMDVVFLLAVDEADAETDYFSAAYPTSSTYGNRVLLRVPTEFDYFPTDKIRFYRGDAGDGSADELVDEREMFPSGSRAGGWGSSWGTCWGVGAYGSGWGVCWGLQWGLGAFLHDFKTGPLPPGAYPVQANVVDKHGNESTATTGTVTLKTYARPAKDLAVDSYTKGTDTLVLTFTASEDIT